ncbi:Hypothetical predicted protein [Prunus dulcis]|uniref:Uncharacterized protein n=1 Tax=Prunus dulcis TaxID=3755 RepID=A0A5E4G7F4_PRUDU|nr:Hypothetical predicted protein [Prunus dulcis]
MADFIAVELEKGRSGNCRFVVQAPIRMQDTISERERRHESNSPLRCWEISAASYKPVLPTVAYIHGTGPLLVGIS